MTQRRVLMLTSTWPPLIKAGTHRPLRLARRLPELGWQPTILTPIITRTPYEGSLTLDFDVETPQNVEVLRPTARMPRWRTRRRLAQLAGLAGQLRNFQRVASRLSWEPIFFPEWTKGASRVAQAAHAKTPFDVVWATGDPWGIFSTAKHISKTLGIPLVLDYRDPWTASPDRPSQSGLKHQHQRKIEADCVTAAQGISYVHPRCLTENERIFSRPKDAVWKVIYNGYEPIETSLPPIGEELPTIVHGGICYGGRSAVPVLEALSRLPESDQPRTP